ncbi:MAG: hypothetical protein CMP24_01955 [Rickettsiales bacterium]|nr:hypothetical protein [Rickettsiales bacterium]
MGKIISFLSKFLFIYFLYLFNLASANLDDARNLFLEGEYLQAMELCKNINSNEALILQSRILSIHAFFFKKDAEAKNSYLEAYKIAKKVINNDDKISEAYVEAAHALGRYGQEIGIISAISKGIAEKIKKYLDKALFIEPDDVIANLSMGIWHAEIISKSGKTFANLLYGAKADDARLFLRKALQLNDQQIGVLYEAAYGFKLLKKPDDILLSKKLIKKLLTKDNFSHMDSLYKIKAKKLLKEYDF